MGESVMPENTTTQLLRNLIAECRAGVASLNDLDNALTDHEAAMHLPFTEPAPAGRMVKLRHAWAGTPGPLSIAACGHLYGTDLNRGDSPIAYDVEDCAGCVAVVELELDGATGH
jgi:hypothetical protein